MANEKRLIDANALEYHKFCYMSPNDAYRLGWNEAIAAVMENAPTVDAVEVVHGRWEKAEYNGFLRCSECKDVYINEEWLEDGKWNYCPNCGADMR